jgi:hypothetical protein
MKTNFCINTSTTEIVRQKCMFKDKSFYQSVPVHALNVCGELHSLGVSDELHTQFVECPAASLATIMTTCLLMKVLLWSINVFLVY